MHRSYSVEEAALALGVHKNTVRAYLKNGLRAIDNHRPTLIHGPALIEYLEERRTSAKQICALDEIFCVKCRMPRRPAGGMVDYIPANASGGSLRAICPHCLSFMYRRIRAGDLQRLRAILDVKICEPVGTHKAAILREMAAA